MRGGMRRKWPASNYVQHRHRFTNGFSSFGDVLIPNIWRAFFSLSLSLSLSFFFILFFSFSFSLSLSLSLYFFFLLCCSFYSPAGPEHISIASGWSGVDMFIRRWTTEKMTSDLHQWPMGAHVKAQSNKMAFHFPPLPPSPPFPPSGPPLPLPPFFLFDSVCVRRRPKMSLLLQVPKVKWIPSMLIAATPLLRSPWSDSDDGTLARWCVDALMHWALMATLKFTVAVFVCLFVCVCVCVCVCVSGRQSRLWRSVMKNETISTRTDIEGSRRERRIIMIIIRIWRRRRIRGNGRKKRWRERWRERWR